MEKQTYKIKNGEISFDNEKIIIHDNEKKQNRLRIFTSGIWIFYGISSFIRYYKTNDQFLLWSGLLISVMYFVNLILALFRTSKDEILKSDIVSLELKHRLGNKFLDIKLTGNKIRRVNHINNIHDELSQYIEANFNK